MASLTLQQIRDLINRGELLTSNVDNIIYSDLLDGDNSLDVAYEALNAFVNGRTNDTAPGEFEQTAANIGNAITRALFLAGDNPEAANFAIEAARSLSNAGILETKDVDNIIYADLQNKDGNLDASYEALNAFVNGRTFDTAPGQFEQVAEDIVAKTASAAGRSGAQGEQFADTVAELLENYTDTSALV